jgi:hypothetical protein
MSRTVRVAVTLTAVTGVAVLAYSTPALAQANFTYGASGYFVSDGEHLHVCDDVQDGHSAVAVYTRSDVPGQTNTAWDTKGISTCTDHNMNMPEGATIRWKICVGESSSQTWFGCSDWVTDHA